MSLLTFFNVGLDCHEKRIELLVITPNYLLVLIIVLERLNNKKKTDYENDYQQLMVN